MRVSQTSFLSSTIFCHTLNRQNCFQNLNRQNCSQKFNLNVGQYFRPFHSFKRSSGVGQETSQSIKNHFGVKFKRLEKNNVVHSEKQKPKSMLSGPAGPNSREASSLASGWNRSAKDIWKPILFAFGFGGCCYCGAVIWQHERLKKIRHQALNVKSWGYEMPHRKAGEIRDKVNQFWNSLTDGQKVVYSIIALNTLVFLCWQTVRLQSAMSKYFLLDFFGEKLYSSMILSTFSHVRFWHIFLNMYALSTFGTQAVDHLLGLEQFVGFYFAAGAMSSCASAVSKGLSGLRIVSLGASGAILAVLIYSCARLPHQRLQIMFVPFFSFTCEQAIVGIIAFDTIGLFLPRQYKIFDHAAHLGGSLFGLWYAKYGEEMLWKVHKHKVIDMWRDLSGRR